MSLEVIYPLRFCRFLGSDIYVLHAHPPLVNKKEQFEEKVYIIITLNNTFNTIKTPNKKNFAELSAPFTLFSDPSPTPTSLSWHPPAPPDGPPLSQSSGNMTPLWWLTETSNGWPGGDRGAGHW